MVKPNWTLSFKDLVLYMTVAVALSLGIFVSVQADDTLQKSLDDNSQVRTSFCGVNRSYVKRFSRLTWMITTGTVLKKRNGAVYIRLGVNGILKRMWTLKEWTKGRGSNFR